MLSRIPYASKPGVRASIDRYHWASHSRGVFGLPENSLVISRTSSWSASSSRRRQLRSWACRSVSSVLDQLKTGLSVRIVTPVSS